MESQTERQEQPQSVTSTPNAQAQSGSPPPVPQPRSEPAVFPGGFWARVDYMLHHPEEVIESLRADASLWQLARIFLAISLCMAALYGAVMGATGLLQGTAMPMNYKLLTILCTAIKVPVLYLVTLAIVLPPIYVSNAFVGARLRLRQMISAVLGALAITVTALGSMATVAAFFALTSRSYHFIKLLHVAVFAYAGFLGLSYLARCMRVMVPSGRKAIPRGLFALWLALYMFVGTQMAWVLRPFVGSPGSDFQLFRARAGNFYESVAFSIRDLFRKD